MGWVVFTIVLAIAVASLFSIRAYLGRDIKRREVKLDVIKKSLEESHSSYGLQTQYNSIADSIDDARAWRKGLVVIGLAVAGLWVVVTGFASVYTQDVGESVVIRNLGGTIAGIDESAGFSVKAPYQSLVSYNIRNQVITMRGDGRDVDGPAISAQTKDNTTTDFDITVRYSINPSAVGDIYTEFRSQELLVQRALLNDLRSIAREVPIKYPTASLRQERVAVQAEIQERLTDRWKPIGVIVDQVDLRDFRYPQEIEDSLKRVQQATADIATAQAELEKARVEAEKTRTEARAQADADQIVRCGATQVTVTEDVNGKQTKVTKVVPVPINECQNRLNEQVLTNKYIDMLAKAAASGNTIYVVPQDSNNLLNLNGRGSRSE